MKNHFRIEYIKLNILFFIFYYYYLSDKNVNINYIFFKSLIDIIDINYY